MSSHRELVYKQAKAYHNHQHLLLQFIWTELILASEHITASLEILHSMEKSAKKSERKSLIDALSTHITTLSGSAHDYMRLFAWGDDGILSKLKNYCSLFAQNSEDYSKVHLAISREANKAWLLSLEVLDLMHDTHSGEELSDAILKIKHTLSRLKRLIAEVVLEFRKDENVLFFILRQHEKLESLHREGFTKKILQKMYPKGLKELERFMIKGYTARGFHHLLPFIRTKIEQLHPL